MWLHEVKDSHQHRMHLMSLGSVLLNIFLWLLCLHQLLAVAVSLNYNSKIPAQTHAAVASTSKFCTRNMLRRRDLGVHYLGDGWIVYFKAFMPFVPSWTTAWSLSHFWSEIAEQVSNKQWMPDDQFNRNSISIHKPLPPGKNGLAVDLVFEVFNLDGPLSREFLHVVAASMMSQTLKGFCGTFNARLSREAGETFWIILRLRGLAESQAAAVGQL